MKNNYLLLFLSILCLKPLYALTDQEVQLLRAANKKDLNAVTKLIKGTPVKKGVNVNVQDSDGLAPLILASENGANDVVSYLLSVPGIDTSLKDKKGNTALLLAITHNHPDTAKLLLETARVIKVTDPNMKGITPLLATVSQATNNVQNEDIHTKWIELASMLQKKGAGINLTDSVDQKVLEEALKNKVKITVPTVDPKLPRTSQALRLAASNGYLNLAKFLIKQGTDVNNQNQSGQSPLMLAAYKGDFDLAKLLLDKGATVDLQDQDGNTALAHTHFGKEEETKLKAYEYYDEGQRPWDASWKTGYTKIPHEEAIARNKERDKIASLLLQKGANYKLKNKRGKSYLDRIAKSKNQEIIKLILPDRISKGDIATLAQLLPGLDYKEMLDDGGNTVLHAVLNASIPPDTMTQMIAAVFQAQPTAAQKLLNIKNKIGKAPLELATNRPEVFLAIKSFLEKSSKK
jgi:ankyrin repeat protein